MSTKYNFVNRLKTMLRVDTRRMLTTPLFYIMIGISVVMPILILVMTSMMDGMVSVNPQTGEETIIHGFDSVWQIIGSVAGAETSMSMDITSMCNINMMYFVIAVFVCIFVSQDFGSGYSKNLFAVRSNKSDYVVSKSIVCFAAGAIMLIAFFVGAMLGGVFAGLPFDLDGVNAGNIVMSMLSKIFLVMIFVSIYILASVVGKQKLWMSLLLSLGIGMLFFTMVPMITPLNSTIMNVMMTLVGGGLFGAGIGVGSYYIMKKTSLV